MYMFISNLFCALNLKQFKALDIIALGFKSIYRIDKHFAAAELYTRACAFLRIVRARVLFYTKNRHISMHL